MAISDKIFYNQASAAKLGWDPSWFGARGFNDILINNIKNQLEILLESGELGLVMFGMKIEI